MSTERDTWAREAAALLRRVADLRLGPSGRCRDSLTMTAIEARILCADWERIRAVEPQPTIDDAMQDFLDNYGSQFLSLEGPDMNRNWHAEVIASGVTDAVCVANTPAAAIDGAVKAALKQELPEPDTGGKERG